MNKCFLIFVENGTFDSLWRLEYINFNQNQITEFPEEFGLASKSLNTLIVYDAFNLSSVPLLTNLTKLTNLNLGKNRFQHFDVRKLPRGLTILNLNFVLKQPIPPNFARWFTNLEIIHLWNTHILEFPAEIIQNLNITKLNLNLNKLTTMPEAVAFPYLENLRLQSNKLTSLPDFFNTSLKVLFLSDNPLICDQDLCWLRMWPWVSNTTILADTPTCASPNSLTGTPLMEADPVVMQCYGRFSIKVQDAEIIITERILYTYVHSNSMALRSFGSFSRMNSNRKPPCIVGMELV